LSYELKRVKAKDEEGLYVLEYLVFSLLRCRWKRIYWCASVSQRQFKYCSGYECRGIVETGQEERFFLTCSVFICLQIFFFQLYGLISWLGSAQPFQTQVFLKIYNSHRERRFPPKICLETDKCRKNCNFLFQSELLPSCCLIFRLLQTLLFRYLHKQQYLLYC